MSMVITELTDDFVLESLKHLHTRNVRARKLKFDRLFSPIIEHLKLKYTDKKMLVQELL